MTHNNPHPGSADFELTHEMLAAWEDELDAFYHQVCQRMDALALPRPSDRSDNGALAESDRGEQETEGLIQSIEELLS